MIVDARSHTCKSQDFIPRYDLKGGIEISSNPDYHPILHADPSVSSNAPSLGSSGEPGHPQFDFCFLVRGEASVRGAQTLTQGSRLVLTAWGNMPSRHTSREKYTCENIYARCQSSIGYLAWLPVEQRNHPAHIQCRLNFGTHAFKK